MLHCVMQQQDTSNLLSYVCYKSQLVSKEVLHNSSRQAGVTYAHSVHIYEKKLTSHKFR
jgi:hypothetical protein